MLPKIENCETAAEAQTLLETVASAFAEWRTSAKAVIRHKEAAERMEAVMASSEPATAYTGNSDLAAESDTEGPGTAAVGSDGGETGVDWPAEAAHLANLTTKTQIKCFRENVETWANTGDRIKMLGMIDDRLKAIKAG